MRPVLTTLAIGFFLLIALASDVRSLLDTSTNTTVAIKDCESKPEVQGTLHVTGKVVDEGGNPVIGVVANVYITHQKVRSDTCAFDVVFSHKNNFYTGTDGKFNYEGPQWIHDNSQDLWRVEISWGSNQGFVPQPQHLTLVKYYSNSNFNFEAIEKPPL